MRVAVLAHSFPRFPGDTHGPFVKALSEALARRGHEVFALVPFDPELRPDPGSPLDIRSFRYIRPDAWHVLGYSRTLKGDQGMKLKAWLAAPLYQLFAERALERLVRAERIDLIHAHWVLPNGFAAARVARRTGASYAVTLHGSDVFMAEQNRWLGAMARFAVRGAAHLTSCSADLRDRLIAIAGEEQAGKIHLVANGTEAIDPGAGRAAAKAVRERLGLGPELRVVAAAGRLVDKKGFRFLLAAAPEILAVDKSVRIVVGGGGELRGTLEAQARELGVAERVCFTGVLSQDEVKGLLALAEVFVMPSVRDPGGNIDGLPIVVLEAMAAGTPVVASGIAGMPLAVADGVTGLLVPEQDAAALGRAVIRLLDEREAARAMGEAGRARVARELNWDAVAAVHDRLYGEAARHARAGR